MPIDNKVVNNEKIFFFIILSFISLLANQNFLKPNYNVIYQDWFLKNDIAIHLKNQSNNSKQYIYFFRDKPSDQIKHSPPKGKTNVWLYQRDENFKILSIYYLGRDLNPIYTIDFAADKFLRKYTFFRSNDKQKFSKNQFKAYYFDKMGKIISFIDNINQPLKKDKNILKINYNYQSLAYDKKDFNLSNHLTDYLVSKKIYLNDKLNNEEIEIYQDNIIQQKIFLKIEDKKKTKIYEVYYEYEDKLINQKVTEYYYYPENFIFKTNIHYWLNDQISHSYFDDTLVHYRYSNKQLKTVTFLPNRHSQTSTAKKNGKNNLESNSKKQDNELNYLSQTYFLNPRETNFIIDDPKMDEMQIVNKIYNFYFLEKKSHFVYPLNDLTDKKNIFNQLVFLKKKINKIIEKKIKDNEIHYQYNEKGLLIEKNFYKNKISFLARYLYDYDNNNNLITETFIDRNKKIQRKTKYFYNENPNKKIWDLSSKEVFYPNYKMLHNFNNRVNQLKVKQDQSQIKQQLIDSLNKIHQMGLEKVLHFDRNNKIESYLRIKVKPDEKINKVYKNRLHFFIYGYGKGIQFYKDRQMTQDFFKKYDFITNSSDNVIYSYGEQEEFFNKLYDEIDKGKNGYREPLKFLYYYVVDKKNLYFSSYQRFSGKNHRILYSENQKKGEKMQIQQENDTKSRYKKYLSNILQSP